MSEKHPDRTKEWHKQQEALRSPKPIPIKIDEKKSQKTSSAKNEHT
ncbi:MAG: hypothetical protein LLG02_03790 [Pelosinus sp.]|nr:hypothetical protein [Pelosinus sp.]